MRWRHPRWWGTLRQPMRDARWGIITLYFLLSSEGTKVDSSSPGRSVRDGRHPNALARVFSSDESAKACNNNVLKSAYLKSHVKH